MLATEKYDKSDPVNIGAGFEIAIRDLVVKVRLIVGYTGKIVLDTSKPNGQPRRMLDVSRAREEFGYSASMDFDAGLKLSIDWYKSQSR